jgi:hypothetical protein
MVRVLCALEEDIAVGCHIRNNRGMGCEKSLMVSRSLKSCVNWCLGFGEETFSLAEVAGILKHIDSCQSVGTENSNSGLNVSPKSVTMKYILTVPDN